MRAIAACALSSGTYSWPTSEKGKEIPDAVLKGLKEVEEKRTPQQKTAIANHFQWASPEVLAEEIEVADLEKQIALFERQKTVLARDPLQVHRDAQAEARP